MVEEEQGVSRTMEALSIYGRARRYAEPVGVFGLVGLVEVAKEEAYQVSSGKELSGAILWEEGLALC